MASFEKAELVDPLVLASGEEELAVQNNTGFPLEEGVRSVVEELILNSGEESVDPVFQNNNGCLVDTEETVLGAVDFFSPDNCQKSKGDFEEKSNLVGLAEGDCWVVSGVVEDKAVDVAQGVVEVVAGSVSGLAQD